MIHHSYKDCNHIYLFEILTEFNVRLSFEQYNLKLFLD